MTHQANTEMDWSASSERPSDAIQTENSDGASDFNTAFDANAQVGNPDYIKNGYFDPAYLGPACLPTRYFEPAYFDFDSIS